MAAEPGAPAAVVVAPRRRLDPRLGLLVVAAVALSAFLSGLDAPLPNSDDAMFGWAVRDAIRDGRWLDYRWFGASFQLAYPPLALIFDRLAATFAGTDETGLRLAPALFSWGTLLVAYAIAARLASPARRRATGLLAATSLAALSVFYYFGRGVLLDPALGLGFALAQLGVVAALEAEGGATVEERARARRRWRLAGLAAGAALMAKGFAAVPGLAGLGLALLVGPPTGSATWRDRARGIGAFVTVAAAVALPWHLWQVARLGRPFLAQYLGYNLVARVSGVVVGGSTSPLFYVERLVHMEPLLGPALLVGGGACALLWLARRRDARLGAIVLPIVVLLVAFSLSRSRLYKYVYPATPSLAIAAAVALDRALEGITARLSPAARRWLDRGAPLIALVPAAVFVLYTVPVTAHAGPDLTAVRDLSARARELLPDGATLLVFDDYHVAAAFYVDRPTRLLTPSERVEATLLAVPCLRMSDTIRRVPASGWPALLDATPHPVALARRDLAPLVVAAMRRTHHRAPLVEEQGGYDLIYPAP